MINMAEYRQLRTMLFAHLLQHLPKDRSQTDVGPVTKEKIEEWGAVYRQCLEAFLQGWGNEEMSFRGTPWQPIHSAPGPCETHEIQIITADGLAVVRWCNPFWTTTRGPKSDYREDQVFCWRPVP